MVALAVVPQTFAAGWIKSVAEAEKQAKAKNAVIFVDLFAQWCGWCHKFESDVYPSEAFQKATEKMVLLRLDTEDGKDGTAFAQRYQITSLPTFVMLNPDQTIVGFIRGYAPPSDFAKLIDDTLAKYRDFQKSVDAEKKNPADYQKRLDIAREFRFRQDYVRSAPRLKKLTTERGVPPSIRDSAYYELGVVYLMQGKYADVQKTVEEFRKVQKEGEPFERATLLKTDVCLAQGNLRCAVDELRGFKEQFPNSPLIPNVDMMLPSIERQLGPVKQ